MNEVNYKLYAISKKPSRNYRKGRKYDPILDEFLSRTDNLVKVEVENKDANYLRTQLNKRIEARDINERVKVSVVNNITYLEKM